MLATTSANAFTAADLGAASTTLGASSHTPSPLTPPPHTLPPHTLPPPTPTPTLQHPDILGELDDDLAYQTWEVAAMRAHDHAVTKAVDRAMQLVERLENLSLTSAAAHVRLPRVRDIVCLSLTHVVHKETLDVIGWDQQVDVLAQVLRVGVERVLIQDHRVRPSPALLGKRIDSLRVTGCARPSESELPHALRFHAVTLDAINEHARQAWLQILASAYAAVKPETATAAVEHEAKCGGSQII